MRLRLGGLDPATEVGRTRSQLRGPGMDKEQGWDRWWDLRNMAGWSLCWGTQGSGGVSQRPQALRRSPPGWATCLFLFENFVFRVQMPRATVAPALVGQPRASLLQSIYMFQFPTALTAGSSRARATLSPASLPLDGQALLSYPKIQGCL